MSLQELCLKNIAESVAQMPPVMQDMVIQDSTEHIKKEAKIEARKEVTLEVREVALSLAKKEICDILPYIVPEIMQDIINSITRRNIRQNYYEKYPHIDMKIVTTAIQTAEYAVNAMEERYVHSAFNEIQSSDSDDESIDHQEYY